MHKPSLIAASIFGSTAVIIGAFAAHALKKALPVDALQTIETAVRYQMYHAIVLLMLCLSNTWISAKSIKRIYRLLLSGILCFSGSIYLLIFLKSYQVIGLSGIGIITPIGGILLILAWILLLIEAYKFKENSSK
ncbi:MAG: hypothetical protein RL624_1811 [Bacteroidota bacterium]|jgi:uncharacterized membrane protein YgdD (TMEM256/DUF423 family)